MFCSICVSWGCRSYLPRVYLPVYVRPHPGVGRTPVPSGGGWTPSRGDRLRMQRFRKRGWPIRRNRLHVTTGYAIGRNIVVSLIYTLRNSLQWTLVLAPCISASTLNHLQVNCCSHTAETPAKVWELWKFARSYHKMHWNLTIRCIMWYQNAPRPVVISPIGSVMRDDFSCYYFIMVWPGP